MSLAAAARAKMLEIEQDAGFLDRTADYDADKIVGFFVKALGPGGKTFDLQINATDPEYRALMDCFDAVLTKRRLAARATVSAVIAHA